MLQWRLAAACYEQSFFMREGSLEAPVRHPIDWENPDFTDEGKLDAEMRRIFDICHGCRRCFNLCDSFPRLFDLVDATEVGEVEGVASADFKQVVDACTLCDMCFMTKCPYVPPHVFNVDFPHLMLRYRAVEAKKGHNEFADLQLAQTDRNGARHGAERRVALIRQPVRGCQYGHQCPERENAEQLSAAERLGAPGRDRIAIGGVYHTFIIRRVEAERSIEKCNWSRGRAVGNKHARMVATASVIH